MRPRPSADKPHPSLRRLRLRLTAALIAANLLVGVAISAFLYNSYGEKSARARELVGNYARVLAGDLEVLFSKIDSSLQSVGDEITEHYQYHGRIDWPKLQRFIDRESARLDGVNGMRAAEPDGLRIVDRDGFLVLVSNERLEKPVNVADRDRFKALRDNPDAGLLVSRPEKGRVSGQWKITFARRLTGPDGGFGGEAHVKIPISELRRILSQIKLGAHGAMSLWNETPAMIARFPDIAQEGGVAELAPQPSKELRALIEAKAAQGDYNAVSGLDNVSRFTHMQRLGRLPLYLIVGAAVQDFLAPLRTETLQFAGLYALLIFASSAGGMVFYSRAAARFASDEQSRLAGLVYDNSAEGMIVIDGRGVILGVNQAFVELTGRTRKETIGRPFREIADSIESRRALRRVLSALRRHGRWSGEIACARAGGEPFLARASVTAIDRDESGRRRAVALFSDITEQKRAEEAVWRHANFDTLTGLPNRRMFRERLDEEIAHARRVGANVAVAFLDLDRFKEVNDSLGHQFGDQLLAEAAARVRACVRAGDLVARLGGDEFTVVMSDLRDSEPALRAAAAIVEALSAPFTLDGEPRFVSASLGVTMFPQDATEAEDLVRNADLAMYEAKRAGRARYLVFEPGMQKANSDRAAVVNDLHQALVEGQFELHYQPIVDLVTGRAREVEALLRWNHPTRGLIGPGEFVVIAEETGLITEIGAWVFREAARQWAEWRRNYPASPSISVNVSPVQFARSAAKIREFPNIAREFGVERGGLVVEITEGVLLDASEEVRDLLACYHDGGLEIALDDFGIGYSSLAYLKQFQINFLKIDRAFVRGLHEGSSDLAICEAIIAMAHKLGIVVVAEGVETEMQRALLAESYCDFAQGYLFARPMTAEAFEAAFLRKGRTAALFRAAS